MARVAAEVNRTVENIGARRLYSVIERIVEVISFDAPEKAGERFTIDEAYVKERTADLLVGGDMRKYIL
jgi:ATP-dependent HslUV protease ATP-binding subunit HslU